VTKVITYPTFSMTFATAAKGQNAIKLRPMEAIATITLYAAITCGIALVGIIWRHAECADLKSGPEIRRSGGSQQRGNSHVTR